MPKNFWVNNLFVLPSTNEKIEKFINYIMKKWKKNIARKIFFSTLEDIKANWHINPMIVFEWAIENASPHIMIKSKRIWGAIYQVPIEVPQKKRIFYWSKRILESANSKKWKKIFKKLSEELILAYNNQWNAVKKKEDTHKMAEANKAYAYLAKYVK